MLSVTLYLRLFQLENLLDLPNLVKASGLKEITDKCFLKYLTLFLNSWGILALEIYKTSFFELDTIFTMFVLLVAFIFKLGKTTSTFFLFLK